jgi:hypothetical protein
LLQEHIEQANPIRKELTKDEGKRLSKLEEIAARLKFGKDVHNRQLQSWLTEDEYAQIEAVWNEQLELCEELKHKPSELKRYIDKIFSLVCAYSKITFLITISNTSKKDKFFS